MVGGAMADGASKQCHLTRSAESNLWTLRVVVSESPNAWCLSFKEFLADFLPHNLDTFQLFHVLMQEWHKQSQQVTLLLQTMAEKLNSKEQFKLDDRLSANHLREGSWLGKRTMQVRHPGQHLPLVLSPKETLRHSYLKTG